MHDWAHREQALRVYKDNHALESESTGSWQHFLGTLGDHFIAEDEAYTEFTFKTSSEVDRDLYFFIWCKLEGRIIISHQFFDVEVKNDGVATQQEDIFNRVRWRQIFYHKHSRVCFREYKTALLAQAWQISIIIQLNFRTDFYRRRQDFIAKDFLFLFQLAWQLYTSKFWFDIAIHVIRLSQIVLTLEDVIQLPAYLLDNDITCLEGHNFENYLNLLLAWQLHLSRLRRKLNFFTLSLFFCILFLITIFYFFFDVAAAQAQIGDGNVR